MIPLVYCISHDAIFQGVKLESSLLAERRKDDMGVTLFEEFVFDEEYMIKFKELFFDGQANVIPVTAAYTREIPHRGGYFEVKDFSKNRDFKIELLMPDDFLLPMAKVIDIKLKEYFIAYIMYRWCETKLLTEAALFRDRANKALEDIKSGLDKRNKPHRRRHGLF